MQISDSKQLTKAINSLESKKVIEEDRVLENLYAAKQYFDPVYHINNLLPRKVPLREALNTAITESIQDPATFGLGGRSKDSFLKRARNSLLHKATVRVLSKNAGKIKAIGFAIVKNILS